MPLDHADAAASVFIVGDRVRRGGLGGMERGPIGSGFIASVNSTENPDVRYQYVVTARHVLDDKDPRHIEIRARAMDGELHTLPVTDWRFPCSDNEDIAIAPFDPEGDLQFFDINMNRRALPEGMIFQVRLGQVVYYVGLLDPIREMGIRGVPMVRSGTLGAAYQDNLSFDTGYKFTGHLIDCRSYGGFSGSPCYIEFEYVDNGSGPMVGTPMPVGLFTNLPGRPLYSWVFLIGMLAGHIPDPPDEREADGVESRFGVGALVPYETIWAALMADDLKRDRSEKDRQRGDADHGPEFGSDSASP